MSNIRFTLAAGFSAANTATCISYILNKDSVSMSAFTGGTAVFMGLLAVRECASEVALWLKPTIPERNTTAAPCADIPAP